MTASIVRSWATILLMFVASSSSSSAGTMPTYALNPGQLLTYEENQNLQSKDQESRYKRTLRLWVTGRNDDGSWRVVAREGMKVLSKQPSSSPEREEMVTFARFDLKPDGNVSRSPTLGTRIDPSHVFPRLPRDEKEAAAGWQARDDRDDTTIRYEPLARAEKEKTDAFDFVGDQSSFMEKIYEGKDRRTFHFDRKKGLVTHAEIERAFDAHMNGKGTGTLELSSVEELGLAKLAAFREQMDRYFDAQQAYHELYRAAEKSGGGAEAILKKAYTILTDARAKVTIPEAIAVLDEALKNHDNFAPSQIRDAKRLAELIGHPAPTWEIKDLEGKTQSLEHYRGKVLVLDFWYRGCGWCMRAMPQVKAVASNYRGKPVAVFGMNNDGALDDAKFVVQKMQLEYPVLRSDELPGKYGVTGFPTLIIVDQQGKVADVHVGYSPQLFEEVTTAVDRLLAGK
jgi:thiol-disulfide isomerase/thioredoxin